MKIVIIGGVAGGAGTATRLRRMDEKAEIIIFERGNYLSYANCGLPYYIGGTIKERDNLFVMSNDTFRERFKIDVRTNQEVEQINPAGKTIIVKNLQTGVLYEESYDKLVVSPGAAPFQPHIAGIHSKRIFTLRTVPDADNLKTFVTQNNVRNAVVVGGGFIGLEMAENLHEIGIAVTLLEMANQVMAPLDFSMASIVHQHLKEKGIKLLLTKSVAGFKEKDNGIVVELQQGDAIEADMVMWSVGVRPEVQLAQNAGLVIGALGGIKTNDYLQTSDPDIYALGDAIEITHPVTKQPMLLPLAGPANKQARIVADNIVLGNKKTYRGTLGSSIAKVFDLTVASTGANAKMLMKAGIKYQSSYTHSFSHATYYPGAKPLTIKITFSPETGQLYGAQVVGFDGVDKRIEMLAAVIARGGNAVDLCDIEHAYAPPYSSAKDPVNMAGFVADNILSGNVKTVHWRDVLNSDAFILDVRTAKEYADGNIKGSVNIPLDELRERLNEIPANRTIYITCAIGLRGYTAYRILKQSGFDDIANLSGGFKTYQIAMAPV